MVKYKDLERYFHEKENSDDLTDDPVLEVDLNYDKSQIKGIENNEG